MLYLNPPFHIIDGIVFLPDHADKLQYYYMPLPPKLTQMKDEVSGFLVPQIQLIKYRGSAGNGGFLNFDVNIGVTQDDLNAAGERLMNLDQLRQPPRLAPIPVEDGTVRMLLFGKQTGDSPVGSTDTQPQFVTKIDQAAKPALYGDNQAAFSIALDQYGVTVLEQAIQGEMTPIGIVYSLDYLALRPAYAVRLSIDWNRVQQHLDEEYKIDALYVSTDIDKTVDKLIDDRVIDLQADTFVPEGEDTSGIISRRDLAINEVRDMITNAFFQPSIDPVKQAQDGWDKAEHLAERASAIAVTGGWGAIGTFTYRKIDYTRIDQKLLNVNISERTTVKRSIYPQGHLVGLFNVLRQPGIDLNRFVVSADLDNPWFARRKVNVISRGNFEQDSLQSLNVNLHYGNEPQNVLLEASNARGEVEWASILFNGVMQRDVTVNYKVSFKGVDRTARPIELTSPDQVTDVDNLEVQPRDLYSIVPIPIVALNFPWDHYPFVEVRLQYTDAPNGINMSSTIFLKSDHTEDTWKIFVLNNQLTQFQYKLIYRAADNKDVEMARVQTSAQEVTIRDPYPKKRTVTVVPDVDWSQVLRVFVDLSYNDAANSVSDEGSLEFTQNDANPKSFTVDLVNPDLRLVEFEATVMFKDGHLYQVPHSATLDRRIFIRSDMKGHKIILIHPDAVDFASDNLQQITLEIRYNDTSAGLSFADNFILKSSGDQAHFEFDYVNEQKVSYDYRITYLYANSLSRTTDWATVTTAVLVLPVN